MKLDIGGGLAPTAGYENLDPRHGAGVMRRRVQDGIPLDDGSVDRVRCSHLMEHIPAADRIPVFNDVWRVLRMGCEFEVIVPLFAPGMWGWVADPTHVSLWVKESFDYFTGDIRPAADYGIRPWSWVVWAERDMGGTCGIEGRAVLRKVLGW